MRLKQGLIQVYTGNTDHMNFAPMGLSLRAAGHNLRTYITCFLPHEFMEGAQMACMLLKPNLVINHRAVQMRHHGTKRLDTDIANIKQSFLEAIEVVKEGKFDLVILNCINQLYDQGIISESDLFSLMDKKPGHVELVLTGPGVDENIIDRADLVTEMVYQRNAEDLDRSEDRDTISPTEVITGNGKGKTTYCLGKAMLMSSMGARTAMLQFIKSPKSYGEIMAIKRLPYMEIATMGEGFLKRRTAGTSKRHKDAAKRAWEGCLREIFSQKYGLVILDEINVATFYGLVRGERVREMVFLKPHKLHLLLSGRNAHLEVRESATSVIEMREIKHPYKKGIKARKGIEF